MVVKGVERGKKEIKKMFKGGKREVKGCKRPLKGVKGGECGVNRRSKRCQKEVKRMSK